MGDNEELKRALERIDELEATVAVLKDQIEELEQGDEVRRSDDAPKASRAAFLDP